MPAWLPSVTEILMGSDVPPRKAFIYEHATDAELDIDNAGMCSLMTAMNNACRASGSEGE